MIKAVIFDLDDTLISEKEYVLSGFKVVSRTIAKDYDLDSADIYLKMEKLFEQDSNMLFNRLLESYGLKYSRVYIKYLIECYRNHKPDIGLYEDAKEVIGCLLQKGYKLGMITDGYKKTQRNKLEVLGIRKYFDVIVITDELGRECWKPHEKPYRKVKEELGVEFCEMIYVGDNVKKDFITAKRLGMKTAMIERTDGVYANVEMQEEYMPENRIGNLNELIKLLN